MDGREVEVVREVLGRGVMDTDLGRDQRQKRTNTCRLMRPA